MISEYIGVFLILAGSVIAVISAIGILRFPDAYTRSHAATKSATLAVLLSLFGAFIFFCAIDNFIRVRFLLGFIYVFFYSHVSCRFILRYSHLPTVNFT